MLSVYACGNTCVTSKVNLIQHNTSGRIYTLPLIYILHWDEELQFWVHTAYKLFLSMKGTLMNENNAIVIWVTNGYNRIDSGKNLGGSVCFSTLLIFLCGFPFKKIMSPFMIPAASWGLFPLFTPSDIFLSYYFPTPHPLISSIPSSFQKASAASLLF